MDTRKKLALIFGTPVFITLILLYFYHGKVQEQFEDKTNLIRVLSPLPYDLIESPLILEGEARGDWYFEGDFPVVLLDKNGNQLAAIPVQAQDDWMVEDFVPFYGEMTFDRPQTDEGVLILQKDNPSDLSEYDDELRIPVRFK